MNPLLYKTAAFAKSPSLLALSEWQQKEKLNPVNCAVDENGELLDNLTLELRVHPPEVTVDNSSHDKWTVVTIDSANRPGSLIHVVQHFTELGLRINRARVSSDGGWFVDVFHLSQANGEKLRDQKKVQSIKQMLNVYLQEDEDLVMNGDETDDNHRIESTVLDLAGPDRPGLLAEVTALLTHNGCNVRSAAVWTYKGRVAFVLSVTEKGQPVSEGIKQQRLQQLVREIMGSEDSIVCMQKVRGEVHHDRRLHQLMLREERAAWASGAWRRDSSTTEAAQQAAALDMQQAGNGRPPMPPAPSTSRGKGAGEGAGKDVSPYRSPKFDRPVIDVEYCSTSQYWIVGIRCRDRSKLLFDTVCTLADMEYDIYHATVDCLDDGTAQQEYYIRPHSSDLGYDDERAALLSAMLESSIQRRFPKGLKVHVRSLDRFGCLAALTKVLHQAGLSVTRAKVRTYATSNSSGHTFYLMDARGGPPDRARVQTACQEIGGQLVEAGDEGVATSGGSFRFSFSFLSRQWSSAWGGSPDSGFGSF